MISYDFTASYMYCTPKVRHKTFGVHFRMFGGFFFFWAFPWDGRALRSKSSPKGCGLYSAIPNAILGVRFVILLPGFVCMVGEPHRSARHAISFCHCQQAVFMV